MSDRTLSMKVVIDASSLRQATSEANRLADATRKVGQTARATSADISRQAQVEINAHRQIVRQMAEVRGAGGVKTGSGGGGGGFGIPGPFGALLGAEAVNQAVRAFGRSFLERSRDPERFTPSGLAFDTLRGLPVIGGFYGSLYDLAGGALGFEDVRGMQRNADVLSRINAGANVEAQVAALRANAATTRQAREAQLRAARGDRLAASGALAEFNARPGDFFTEDRLGVSNQAQGQLRLAQVQAEERARAAGSVQSDERQALFARQRERQDAEARLAEARTREAQAQREADAAQAAQRNKGVGLSPAAIAQNQRIDERAEERQNALSQARLSTLKAEQQVREKITAEQQQLERLEKAGLSTIQANVEAAKARLEVQKNQIALLREQESAQKQQARFFGTADEGTRQAAVRAIEAFKRGGLDALTPDEIELAKQVNPRIAEEIIRAQEQRGLNTEENRRVEQLTGYTGLNDLKAEIQQQQENLTRQMLELQKEQAALVERTMAENLKQFTDLFVKAVEAAIANVRSEAAKQIADQKVLQAGQG